MNLLKFRVKQKKKKAKCNARVVQTECIFVFEQSRLSACVLILVVNSEAVSKTRSDECVQKKEECKKKKRRKRETKNNAMKKNVSELTRMETEV